MRALHILKRLGPTAVGIAGLRRDDIWLASFPKAGSSWLRTIIANVIALESGEAEAVDFRHVDVVMPNLGTSNLLRPWPHAQVPRFVKTHQPWRPVVFAMPRRRLYLLRDPRDIMVSYYHMVSKRRANRFEGTLAQFMRHPVLGLPAFFRHYDSWRNHHTCMARYEVLRADTTVEVGNLFNQLGITVKPGSISEAVERSSVKRLRETPAEALPSAVRFDADFRFIRSARPGEWSEHFTKADVQYYEDLRDRAQFSEYA